MSFGNLTISKDSTYAYSSRRKSNSNTVVPQSKIEKAKAKKEATIEKLEQEKQKLEARRKELQQLRQQETARYPWEDDYIYNPLTHQLNLAYIMTTIGYKKGKRYNGVKGSFDASSVNFNQNNNAISFDSLNAKGYKYSSNKGQILAQDIANNSVGFTGYCSRHVREGLQRTNMYNGHTASAYQMGAILAENENFQEVSPNSVDLKKLPAGCILVYDRGAANYNYEHGHIEVTLGDGTACSDGRTYNLRSTQNMRIFVPVEKA